MLFAHVQIRERENSKREIEEDCERKQRTISSIFVEYTNPNREKKKAQSDLVSICSKQ